jgi:hypothetical protein
LRTTKLCANFSSEKDFFTISASFATDLPMKEAEEPWGVLSDPGSVVDEF